MPSPLQPFLSTGCLCEAHRSFLPGRTVFYQTTVYWLASVWLCMLSMAEARHMPATSWNHGLSVISSWATTPLRKVTGALSMPLDVSMFRATLYLMTPHFHLPLSLHSFLWCNKTKPLSYHTGSLPCLLLSPLFNRLLPYLHHHPHQIH